MKPWVQTPDPPKNKRCFKFTFFEDFVLELGAKSFLGKLMVVIPSLGRLIEPETAGFLFPWSFQPWCPDKIEKKNFKFMLFLLLLHPGFSATVTFFLLFFLFGGTGLWTRGFALAKQVLCCSSHTSSPFCSGYFGDGGLMKCLPRLASNCHPHDLSLFWVARITGLRHLHPANVGSFKEETKMIEHESEEREEH
jgi:hypothetical protein